MSQLLFTPDTCGFCGVVKPKHRTDCPSHPDQRKAIAEGTTICHAKRACEIVENGERRPLGVLESLFHTCDPNIESYR